MLKIIQDKIIIKVRKTDFGDIKKSFHIKKYINIIIDIFN